MRSAALLALPFSLGACEWFSDFKRQPSIVTWESFRPDSIGVRGSPQGSVPTNGTAMASFQVSYTPGIAQIDSLAGLVNPTPMSAASLLNGRKYYAINCAVCHGDAGGGDGSAVKYGMAGISLITEMTKGRTDGYIFGMIRNGRGLMPTYNRIEENDRWDVVNYVRALQGTAGMPAETGPLAAPGINGDMVPGPTRLGPTHPAPFVKPSMAGSPGATPNAAPTATAPAPAAGPPDTTGTSHTTGDDA